MPATLFNSLPDPAASSDELLGRFLDYVASKGLTLYPAQEEAILDLFEGKNVILNTPTGSGKSLVASAMHFDALTRGRRSVYTCPIKALVNEKWMALCRELGPENVGLSTGDATVNRDAPVLCCTAEVLANIALREGADARIDDVVMDEFHWYADRDRGVAWQTPLLALKRTRFLLMSATLGDVEFFAEALTGLNGLPTSTVMSVDRPVPLEFSYSEIALPIALEALVAEGKGPVYVVHFTQADAADSAQAFTSLTLSTREEKNAVAKEIEGFKFSSPYGPNVKKWLKSGIGLHHAGLLPKYRVLIEQLAQRGLLKVICGTDTLGVGINVPIRTVLFTRLCKYDGHKTAILSARDFHQIAGRAGRKGFDDVGFVVAQAPEHYIENLRLEEKAAAGGKKSVKRKPPEHNFVNWDKKTFERLIKAPPERLTSRFQVTHAMLLNVLSRPTDGCAAMRGLIRDSHETDRAKKGHFKRGFQLFRSLVERHIVEFTSPRASAHPGLGPKPGASEGVPAVAASEPKVRVNVELQDDFSMNQALSLYLLETIPLLDADSLDYPLDLVTLIESILENPELILRRQLDKVKGKAIAQMKADGMDYEQRMAELEKLEYPKPLAEFVYMTFNEFALKHPWVGEEAIRPKSIAREMFETFWSFSDYVREYEIERAEGLLLRHLNSVYKVLSQTVPDLVKTDAVREMEIYLRTMLRDVDSSLLEEWERMKDPNYLAPVTSGAGLDLKPPGADGPPDITRDAKAFTAAIRNRVFAFIRAWSMGDDEGALAGVIATADEAGAAWTTDRLKAAREEHRVEHKGVRLDPEARNLRHTYVKPAEDGAVWRVQQVIVDTEGINDWAVEVEVDLAASRAADEPVVRLMSVGSLT
jgi:superfamily II RNA helicase